MGKCESEIKKVLFVIEKDTTHCYVSVQAYGDCPVDVQGWHHKAFAAKFSAVDIMTKYFDYLNWPLSAPILHITE